MTNIVTTTHLFPILDQQLIELLRALQPGDWNRRTLAKAWSVKDIAAHLLDGNMRTLSFVRDQYPLAPPAKPISSYEELVAFLNELNGEWVNAYKRVSPQVLTDQLEITGKQYSEAIAKLDPMADAMFAVSWAGESVSKNWFHVAREYTEKWHHQQQIRDAVGIEGIMTRELFYPMIDTLMRGLPHTYRNTSADKGTVIRITVDGETGGDWYLVYDGHVWELSGQAFSTESAAVNIPPGIAWKLFTKGIRPEEVSGSVVLSGNRTLAKVSLQMIAVMA